MALGNFSSLPNDVIFLILSKTSPLDLCRLSAVSSAFQSASLSDVVWNNFMPSKFPEIIFKSIDSSPPFPSKKDFFFHLCTQFRVLLDDGSKVLELDKSSGKICCKLGRGNNLSVTVKPRYNLSIQFIERWGAIYKSRPIYGESPDMPFLNSWSVICLDGQKPLRIHGRLLNPPNVLSPNTTYAAYLDYKITPVDVSFPLFVEVSVKICTKTGESISSQSRFCHDFITSTSAHEEGGWKELKIGEFHNDDNIGVVEMSLKEVKNWLCGSPIVLFVRAINIRPRGVHKICQSSKSTRPNPIRRFLNWIGKSFELVID